MKRIFISLVALLITTQAWADCNPGTPQWLPNGIVSLVITCEGSAVADTTIYMTDLDGSGKSGYYLLGIEAWPVAGGTAPDDADVFVFDATVDSTVGLDLLGSTNGVTAANGANLVSTVPKYHYFKANAAAANAYPPVTGNLTLRVSGQDTADADWKIRIKATR